MNPNVMILVALLVTLANAMDKDGWKSRTIYQVVTDRFAADNMSYVCPDLSNYCGGNFKGLMKNLDYIQGLGFDAIWISPISLNTEKGYHGYHTKDWSKINTNFGTEEELKSLLNECHKRDIKVMLDVVLNHAGPVEESYKEIQPFNASTDYHKICFMTEEDWIRKDQWTIENCRLKRLPDLNHENLLVEQRLLSWTKQTLNSYPVDGLRVDAAANVPREFWEKFKSVVQTMFTIADVPSFDPTYVNKYVNALDSAMNYPLQQVIWDAFVNGKTFTYLKQHIEAAFSEFGQQIYTMGMFFDNHNLPRFMNATHGRHKIRQAVAFIMLFPGIPVFYYGDEQQFSGREIDQNREPLWKRMKPSEGIYQWTRKLIDLRKRNKVWEHPYLELHVSQNTMVFMRGNVVVAFSNDNEKYQVLNDLKVPFNEGVILRELYTRMDTRVEAGGKVQLVLGVDEVKIYEAFDISNRNAAAF